MVTEESIIENELQVQTPTNYHHLIKIQNTKSKSRAEKKKKKKIPQYTTYGSNNRKL